MRRPHARVFGVAAGLLAWTGCFAEQDRLSWQVLDTSLARPRVLAVRLQPPVVRAGTDVQIQAFALGPSAVGAIAADWCPPPTDLPSNIDDACFRNPTLVAPIGDTLPVTWQPPDLSSLSCPEDGLCSATYPLRVTADFDGEPAMAMLSLWQLADPLSSEPPAPLADSVHRLVGDAVAQAGETITLRAEVLGPVQVFRWWTDAGELIGTGRTVVHGDDSGLRWSENRLRIPRDWRGPLRIAVVYVAEAPIDLSEPTFGDTAWDVHTLEVRR